MATFRSHDTQTKRCLTLCRVPLRNLAYLYGSGRVAVYTPNAHSLPLSSQAQSNTAATHDYTSSAHKKSRSMKLCGSRIGFLFCGILTVCTVRIFSRQVFHFTWMRKPKIFCFQLYYTSIYRKVNPISSFDSSIFNKFYCIKNMKRCYVNA